MNGISSIELAVLAELILKDSRPMTDWERKVAADFFWSEFEDERPDPDKD
jgi:hypothetical protein